MTAYMTKSELILRELSLRENYIRNTQAYSPRAVRSISDVMNIRARLYQQKLNI